MPVSLNGETKDNINKLIVNKFLRVPVLTTTERNKLKLEKGLLIFNSTTNKLQVYTTSWVDTH
jgi:hypothetical protein